MNEDISRISGSFIVVGLMLVFGAIAGLFTGMVDDGINGFRNRFNLVELGGIEPPAS